MTKYNDLSKVYKIDNRDVNKDFGIDLENFSVEEEILKYTDFDPRGWAIVLRLYTEPQITKGGIIKTDSTQDDQQYNRCVGLVVAISKAAYSDPRYDRSGPWCKIGEWLVFPRHAGSRITYADLPTFIINEDSILAAVKDPSKVNR